MIIINNLPSDDCKRHRGFTFVELMVVVVIIGIICAIATLVFQSFADKARVIKATAEIATIQTKIKVYETYEGSLPNSLSDLDDFNMLDPWGNPYQYNDLNNIPKGLWRKDKSLVPLNSDYDLWSNGKDGNTGIALTAKASYDDIIRASDGAYIGLAIMF